MKQDLMQMDARALQTLWKESKQARRCQGIEDSIILRPREQEQLIEVLLKKYIQTENENHRLKYDCVADASKTHQNQSGLNDISFGMK